ncbi:MAG: ribokinase [Armatimonadetes bacterium]|nr:ribokinase [Armatimonadota bacterium]
MAKIVVVGSANTDMVVKAPRIPPPGETVLGGEFLMAPGGKGANQAVAAARLGAEVAFIACLGRDLFAEAALANYRQAGIVTDYIRQDEATPSGAALIMVDASGQNAIAVAPGANARLSPEDVERAESAIAGADMLVAQLEVPFDTVRDALEAARRHHVPTLLNPAPAPSGPMPSEWLSSVDILTPNEYEAQALTGLPMAEGREEDLALRLRSLGIGEVIITLGRQGALYAGPDGTRRTPACRVEARDTTAAGDVFTGALACALAEGAGMEEALRFAAHAAAISVTRMGAQPSAPTRSEVDSFLKTGIAPAL